MPPTTQVAATGSFIPLTHTATPHVPLLAPVILLALNPASLPTTSSGMVPPDRSAHSHRIRFVPHIDNRSPLFQPIVHDVVEGGIILRIGRFHDRSGLSVAAANALGVNNFAFMSKAVERAHAEVWCEAGGKCYIRDTRTHNGTFLNHVRLSAADTDSRPFELTDGDTLQLGVDCQGGAGDIYKCVRIRVEMDGAFIPIMAPRSEGGVNKDKAAEGYREMWVDR